MTTSDANNAPQPATTSDLSTAAPSETSVSAIPDSIRSELLAKADAAKETGNKFVGAERYMEALQQYTQAIDHCYHEDTGEEVEDNLHIYYTNRALCHLKLENFGSCIMDAEKALKYKPRWTKAMYRKGCALIMLSKYKEAKREFQTILRITPKDQTTRDRLKECEKQIAWMRFSEAVKAPPLSSTIDVSTIDDVPSDYKGPVFSKSMDFFSELREFYANSHTNVLPKKYAVQLILEAISIFKSNKALVRIDVPVGEEFTMCGDVHGQFYDLLNIFKIQGDPSPKQRYLFNGDFVDRGSFSVECLFLMLAAKVALPNDFFMARGNHETRSMNRMYGFYNEIVAKYGNAEIYELCCELFCTLPLAHVIADKVFVTHGGLFSNDGVTLQDIEQIDRFDEPPMEGIFTDLLWADPFAGTGRAPSQRGVGMRFGKDVTEKFLEENKLQLVLRSHEMEQEGYKIHHDGKCVTVFSAPNYCDQMGNLGAYCVIKNVGDKVETRYEQFSAVSHPPVPSLKYADVPNMDSLESYKRMLLMQQLQQQQQKA